jgi:hypothetical protein
MSENTQKASKLKSAFQWAGAVAAVLSCDAPNRGFVQGGYTYDYLAAQIGSRRKGAPSVT